MVFPSRSSEKREGFADLPDILLIMFHHFRQSSFFRCSTLFLYKDFFLLAISCWTVFQRVPGQNVTAVECFLSVFDHKLEFRCYPWLVCCMQLDGLYREDPVNGIN